MQLDIKILKKKKKVKNRWDGIGKRQGERTQYPKIPSVIEGTHLRAHAHQADSLSWALLFKLTTWILFVSKKPITPFKGQQYFSPPFLFLFLF